MAEKDELLKQNPTLDEPEEEKQIEERRPKVYESENKQIEKRRPKDLSPSPNVKSTAVVKYTAFQNPVEYSRLQCNTDLNLPPSNWGPALDSYGLKQILTSGSGLSSFRMANMFPDCVGNVDVISGAEIIKNLLKLPYQPNGIISIMVHQVEDTLLLDDFNVYDYLMKTEWAWLRDFYYKNVVTAMAERERIKLMLAPAPSAALQHKFLSHSVTTTPQRLPQLPVHTPMCLPGPSLPEPDVHKVIEDEATSEHSYNTNVLWTFEKIHMLIGSDLPIFGDNDRPCVSLRLRDVREPINVLTGIDLWLDNLMCNVPEILMCYHLDGIVQKYEQMKTEDLPNMSGSKFSPKVINNVAQNILSFLKSNVTKAGHTYWLFKGPMDDVVKLYDLTPLCPDDMDNPFTTPVAMLLYRVARNMRLVNKMKHVKELLEHALVLLKVDKHPQLVASSRYMLADLYVPVTTDPAKPDFKEESSDSEYDPEPCASETGVREEEGALAVPSRHLAVRDMGATVQHTTDCVKKRRKRKKLETDPEKRCLLAIENALQGLKALLYVTLEKSQEEERERVRNQILREEQHPRMANPNKPITLNYEPITKTKDSKTKEQTRSRRKKRIRVDKKEKIEKKVDKEEESDSENNPDKDKNAISFRQQKQVIYKLNEPNRNDNFAWKLHLKTLLYEKICLVMATLAELNYKNMQYGLSLKHISLAGKCQKLLSNMIIKSDVVDASCLIGRVGDNFFQIFKYWDSYDQFVKQYETKLEYEADLRAGIADDLIEEDCEKPSKFDLDIELPKTRDEAIEASCAQYERALTLAGSGRRKELLRRLASVRNDLAVRLMHSAKNLYDEHLQEQNSHEAKSLLRQHTLMARKSWKCLEDAFSIFKEVDDVANLVLLYCNKGQYSRLRAHCHKSSGFSHERRKFFKQGEEMYLDALNLLKSREGAQLAELRELVSWELSSHQYTLAVNMQEHPLHYANEMSDVAEAFRKALKYCPLTAGPKQYQYQFRAGMIYHKLASLYHAQFRQLEEDGTKMRTLVGLSRANYSQAGNLFASLEDTAMFLTAQLEHAALMMEQAIPCPNLKLKSLQTALQLLRQSHSVIKLIRDREEDDKPSTHTSTVQVTHFKTDLELLNLYEQNLHQILKGIIQYCRSKGNRDYDDMADMYKKLYCASLKIKKSDDVREYARSVCDVLSCMDEVSANFE